MAVCGAPPTPAAPSEVSPCRRTTVGPSRGGAKGRAAAPLTKTRRNSLLSAESVNWLNISILEAGKHFNDLGTLIFIIAEFSGAPLEQLACPEN